MDVRVLPVRVFIHDIEPERPQNVADSVGHDPILPEKQVLDAQIDGAALVVEGFLAVDRVIRTRHDAGGVRDLLENAFRDLESDRKLGNEAAERDAGLEEEHETRVS